MANPDPQVQDDGGEGGIRTQTTHSFERRAILPERKIATSYGGSSERAVERNSGDVEAETKASSIVNQSKIRAQFQTTSAKLFEQTRVSEAFKANDASRTIQFHLKEAKSVAIDALGPSSP